MSQINAGEWHIKQTVNYGYHHLTDPTDATSTPKLNNQMDVFLMNDATRLANMFHSKDTEVLHRYLIPGQIQHSYTQVCGTFREVSTNRHLEVVCTLMDLQVILKQLSKQRRQLYIECPNHAGKGLRVRKPNIRH